MVVDQLNFVETNCRIFRDLSRHKRCKSCLLTLISSVSICCWRGACCGSVRILILVPIAVATALLGIVASGCGYILAEICSLISIHITMACDMFAVAKTKPK